MRVREIEKTSQFLRSSKWSDLKHSKVSCLFLTFRGPIQYYISVFACFYLCLCSTSDETVNIGFMKYNFMCQLLDSMNKLHFFPFNIIIPSLLIWFMHINTFFYFKVAFCALTYSRSMKWVICKTWPAIESKLHFATTSKVTALVHCKKWLGGVENTTYASFKVYIRMLVTNWNID